MGLFFLGLALGLVFGAAGCYRLLVRLRALLADAATADRLQIREDGLEAVSNINDASRQAQLAMLRTLMPGGDRP
jgi:hypothetical protein